VTTNLSNRRASKSAEPDKPAPAANLRRYPQWTGHEG